MMLNLKQNTSSIILVTAIATTLLICIMMQNAHGAPAASNNNSRGNNNNSNNNNKNGNNNGRLIRTGILSNLFRRQIGSSSPGSTTEASTESSEVDEPQSQTERDAQKFLDSLPNPGSSNSGPSSFRERVSGTFGVLREGVSNHFRSIRENFSDTVDELRDTWNSE